MTTWIAVSEVPPPKDRIIEVTSGWVWHLKTDYIKSQNKTLAFFDIRGAITFARWSKDVGNEKGAWISANGDYTIGQDFTHWREAENPFKNDNCNTSNTPPYFTKSFVGNATKHDFIKKLHKLLADINRILQSIIKRYNNQENIYPSEIRTIKLMIKSIPELLNEIDNSYYPDGLPQNQRMEMPEIPVFELPDFIINTDEDGHLTKNIHG